MARGDRQFKVSVLTDVETAALEKGADKLDELGDQAKTTATKIDGAFEKIASSSRSNVRKVDADLDKAGKALDEFKGEAGSTGREAAASFSGSFDDVGSAIQETAANAFAGFGPAGAVAGMAAAAGLGVVLTKAAETRERIKGLRDAFLDLMVAGERGSNSVAERIREVLDAAKEADVLEDYAEALRDTGVDAEKFARALAGDRQAADELKPILRDLVGINMPWDDQAMEAQHLYNVLVDHQTAYAGAKTSAQLYTDALGGSAEVVKSYAEALAEVGDGSGVMAEAVEASAARQAAATSSTEDSWTDYRDTALASIDDVIAKQLEQLTAAENFETNTKLVLDRLGEAGVEWALSQGENADKAMQLLASAPLEKGQQVVANFQELGKSSTTSYAEGVVAGKPAANAAAADVYAAMAKVLGTPINVPVDVTKPTARTLAGIAYDLAQGIGTVEVPVMLRNVPQSVWSTRRTNS